MARKSSYMGQFKPGAYPDQHWDESTRVNGHEAGPPSPSKMRKRDSVALGSQTEARPGMAGKNDYSRKGRK
jgi:hypothetical protein